MLEFVRNEAVDAEILADLFARCGWEDENAGEKLRWVLAGSAEWVVCRREGELIGFGRSSRLGPVKRVVLDVMVDPRFDHPLVRGQILKLLAQSAGLLEEVSVFAPREPGTPAAGMAEPGLADRRKQTYLGGPAGFFAPPAPRGAYLGRERES
jgi:hypothetical protein